MDNEKRSTSKFKATDNLDTRPHIFGRTVTSTFRKMFSFKHQPPGNLRTGMIPPVVFGALLVNIPKLLKLRFYLKQEKKPTAARSSPRTRSPSNGRTALPPSASP